MNFQTRGIEQSVNHKRRLSLIYRLTVSTVILLQFLVILQQRAMLDHVTDRLNAYSHEITDQAKRIQRLSTSCGGEVRPGIFDENGCHTDGDLKVCTRLQQDTITGQ